MRVRLSEEQEALRASARGLLERWWPLEEAGAAGRSGEGRGAEWWERVREAGWLGLGLPKQYGGQGGGLVDLAVVYEEAGRALAPTTLYSTVAAARAVLAAGGDDQRREILPSLADGRVRATLAVAEPNGSFWPPFATALEPERDRVVLSGAKSFVPNAEEAAYLVVAGTWSPTGEPCLAVVPREAGGVGLEALETFAGDRQCEVRLDRVALEPSAVLGGGPCPEALARAVAEATALQCVEMVGGARYLLDRVVEYTGQRVQFGQPIARFQAVQHHAADLLIAIDAARLAAYQAVWRLDQGLPAEREVAIAKVAAGDAYVSTSLMAFQLHGGMGYVTESGLHLWADRARAADAWFGTREEHLARLGDLVAGGAASGGAASGGADRERSLAGGSGRRR